MSRRRVRAAFSLLELMAVIAILGIVAAVVLPRLSASTDKAKANMCFQFKADLDTAIEKYYANEGKWPTKVEELASEEYYPADLPVCPVTKQGYTIDATKHRIDGHKH